MASYDIDLTNSPFGYICYSNIIKKLHSLPNVEITGKSSQYTVAHLYGSSCAEFDEFVHTEEIMCNVSSIEEYYTNDHDNSVVVITM